MTTKNIASFLESIGHPQNRYKTIHIGGSNGKGTTSYFLYQMFRQQGINVGVYLSPYRNERFDNIIHHDITVDDLKRLYETYQKQMEHYQLTPFEIDTALMYIIFSHKQVSHAIIEVGLGGRDDATNVIDADLSIITSISLEHTDILGPRIEDIIHAKAGIFKSNKDVILSPYLSTYERSLFESYVIQVGGHLLPQNDKSYDIFDIPYLNHNVNLAFHAFRHMMHDGTIDFQSLQVLPYRFEYITQSIILDGAHNLEGIEALIQVIKKKSLHPIVVMSAIKTKPIHDMVKRLHDVSKKVYVTHFDHPDAFDIQALTQIKNTTFIDFDDILTYLKQSKYDTIILTGSLYFLRALEPSLRRLQHE